MQVLLAKSAGFCYGVRRAVELAESAAASGAPCVLLGHIIHNQNVVDRLASMGLRTVERPEEVPEGCQVVIRSHGVPQSTVDQLEELGVPYVDATCPFVNRIHEMAQEAEARGVPLIVVGEERHPEVEGIRGWTRGESYAVADEESARALPKMERALVVSQTTCILERFERVCAALRERVRDMEIRTTICPATRERQDEAVQLAKSVDVMLVVGGKDGLQPIEKTVIDRCVRLIYRDMALGLGDGKPPLLQDLYEELLKQPEPEARRVATALELYCTGSLNLFNHQTNVKLTAHIVCIVLKGLGENLRKIAMHVTNDFVTSAVNVNFHSGVSTWCYFDEFHILLRDALTASYFVAVWKMLRKKGCVPSALTQNVKDLLASREIEAILDNTDFMILLSQAQSDRAILAKQLGISEHQLSYITHSNSGEGLLFYGDVTIPFVDRFPRGEIYNLLTTRPEDLKNEAKTE